MEYRRYLDIRKILRILDYHGIITRTLLATFYGEEEAIKISAFNLNLTDISKYYSVNNTPSKQFPYFPKFSKISSSEYGTGNNPLINDISKYFSHTLISGSNGIAIHGNLTSSGQPIVEADPHLAPSIPSVFVEICGKLREYNYSITFIEGSLLGPGTNGFLAYATTVPYAESTALYIEKLNGTHYLYNDTWLPLR